MWPAIIRTVRRDAPGTVIGHNSDGRFSNKNIVTRLLVFQAARTASARSTSRVILNGARISKRCLALARFHEVAPSLEDGVRRRAVRAERRSSARHRDAEFETWPPV